MSHRPPRGRVLALAILVLAAALAPAVRSESDAAATRILVGFHAYPAAAFEGGLYDGALIVRALPDIRALAVVTLDAPGFFARQALDPNVRYAADDAPRHLLFSAPHFTPDDPQFGAMYGPQQTRVDLAWDTTLGSTDAAVCVIDTGVRVSHEDLGPARYLGGHDFVNDDTDPADDHGHGTHVAGTAVGHVGNALGVAGMGNSGYYAVKVLDGGGFGTWSDVAAGITWCANHGQPRTVLSLSLGGSDADQAVADAVHYAFAQKGMLVVAASGNGHCDHCVGYPAAFPEAIAVACTTIEQASCSFTSKGPQVDVAAPGNNIVSTCHQTDASYCSSSGTSMSTPHVSGILALAWSHAPTLSASELWQRVNDTSEDLGPLGKDRAFGWGRIDAKCLLDHERCSPLPPPLKVHWLESFDDGVLPAGWSATGLWHVSDCRSSSPSWSLAYNRLGCPTSYDTGASNAGTATSPAIAVPSSDATVLKFRSRYATETGSFDVKDVLVSSAGGAFAPVLTIDGPVDAWSDAAVDLSAYGGTDVRIQFRFDTGDSQSNAYEGWYVDDVRLLVASDGPAGRPGAPLALTATAGPGVGQIALAWLAPVDDGGASVIQYRIHRATGPGDVHEPVGTSTDERFTDAGLAEGTSYHYRVSAVNVAGEGPKGAPANATTFARPSAPLALEARPGSSLLSVDLAWEPPASDGGTPVVAYRIYRDGAFIFASAEPSFSDAGREPAAVHTYRVSAVNAVGEGALSTADCSRPSPWPPLLQDVCEIE